MKRHTAKRREGVDGPLLQVRHRIIGEVGALMGRRRMTQTALADQLGWTQPYLSRRLTGHIAFSTDDLTRVAEVFDVPVTELFGRPPTGSEWNPDVLKSAVLAPDDPLCALAS